MQVYDLARLRDGFDLILFLGVLYHLRHPLLAIDIVAERLRGRLLLQTVTLPGPAADEQPHDVGIDERERLAEPGWPHAAFIEHRLAGDPTNWWAADDACVRAMARSAGLRVVEPPGHEIYVCGSARRATTGARRGSTSFARRRARVSNGRSAARHEPHLFRALHGKRTSGAGERCDQAAWSRPSKLGLGPKMRSDSSTTSGVKTLR